MTTGAITSTGDVEIKVSGANALTLAGIITAGANRTVTLQGNTIMGLGVANIIQGGISTLELIYNQARNFVSGGAGQVNITQVLAAVQGGNFNHLKLQTHGEAGINAAGVDMLGKSLTLTTTAGGINLRGLIDTSANGGAITLTSFAGITSNVNTGAERLNSGAGVITLTANVGSDIKGAGNSAIGVRSTGALVVVNGHDVRLTSGAALTTGAITAAGLVGITTTAGGGITVGAQINTSAGVGNIALNSFAGIDGVGLLHTNDGQIVLSADAASNIDVQVQHGVAAIAGVRVIRGQDVTITSAENLNLIGNGLIRNLTLNTGGVDKNIRIQNALTAVNLTGNLILNATGTVTTAAAIAVGGEVNITGQTDVNTSADAVTGGRGVSIVSTTGNVTTGAVTATANDVVLTAADDHGITIGGNVEATARDVILRGQSLTNGASTITAARKIALQKTGGAGDFELGNTTTREIELQAWVSGQGSLTASNTGPLNLSVNLVAPQVFDGATTADVIIGDDLNIRATGNVTQTGSVMALNSAKIDAGVNDITIDGWLVASGVPAGADVDDSNGAIANPAPWDHYNPTGTVELTAARVNGNANPSPNDSWIMGRSVTLGGVEIHNSNANLNQIKLYKNKPVAAPVGGGGNPVNPNSDASDNLEHPDTKDQGLKGDINEAKDAIDDALNDSEKAAKDPQSAASIAANALRAGDIGAGVETSGADLASQSVFESTPDYTQAVDRLTQPLYVTADQLADVISNLKKTPSSDANSLTDPNKVTLGGVFTLDLTNLPSFVESFSQEKAVVRVMSNGSVEIGYPVSTLNQIRNSVASKARAASFKVGPDIVNVAQVQITVDSDGTFGGAATAEEEAAMDAVLGKKEKKTKKVRVSQKNADGTVTFSEQTVSDDAPVARRTTKPFVQKASSKTSYFGDGPMIPGSLPLSRSVSPASVADGFAIPSSDTVKMKTSFVPVADGPAIGGNVGAYTNPKWNVGPAQKAGPVINIPARQ